VGLFGAALGLGFLPLALTVTAGSAAAPAVTRRLGPRAALAVGFGLGTAGLGRLAATADTISYPLLLAGLLVSGVGNGIVFTAMFDLGTRGVPRPAHGSAGGILATTQYLASTLALAASAVLLTTAPTGVRFGHAFLLLTAVAAAGTVLTLTAHRRHAHR